MTRATSKCICGIQPPENDLTTIFVCYFLHVRISVNDAPILILLLLTERSVGLWALRDPPKVPNGVLLAATTKTPRERALLATISEIIT